MRIGGIEIFDCDLCSCNSYSINYVFLLVHPILSNTVTIGLEFSELNWKTSFDHLSTIFDRENFARSLNLIFFCRIWLKHFHFFYGQTKYFQTFCPILSKSSKKPFSKLSSTNFSLIQSFTILPTFSTFAVYLLSILQFTTNSLKSLQFSESYQISKIFSILYV